MKDAKPKNKVTLGIFAAVIATLMVLAIQAGDRGRRMDGMRGTRGSFMITQLELTESQQKKVDALKQKENEKSELLRKEIQAVRRQIDVQMEKEPIDKKKIRSMHAKLHTLRSKIGDARLEFRLGVHDVLTSEQRRKAADHHRKMRTERNSLEKACENCPCGMKRGRRGRGTGGGSGPGFGGGRGVGPGPGA